MQSPKIPIIILLGTVIRLVLIIVTSRNESLFKQQLTTTDIDYKVYTDAAFYQSPYHRHTYRYTPLLAYMMRWNHVVDYAGKLWFVAFDVLAMIGLVLATKRQYRVPVLALYGLNPLFIYLTVRGSCESIALALMYWCFYFIYGRNGNVDFSDIINKWAKIQDNRKYNWVGYILYGLWVHFRLYPIIFLPIILIHQYKLCQKTKANFISRFIQIGLCSGGTFIALFLIFYYKYGMHFVQETFLYHLKRLDNRHSFSPFFYQIYLSLNSQSAIRSIPHIVTLVGISKLVHKSLSPYFAHFLLTYSFVSFNKVITMQYYMWIFGCLLILLPQSTILTNNQRRFQKTLGYSMQYFLGVLLWVWASLKLEKDGENVFNLMWFICIGKLYLDLWALRGFISTIRNKPGYVSLANEEVELEEGQGKKSQVSNSGNSLNKKNKIKN